jgi:hypothetical protein
MSNLITKTVLAAVVALGAFGMSVPANAANVDVDIHIKTPKVVVKPPVVVKKPVIVVKPVIVKPPVVIVKPPVVVVPAGRCAPAKALDKALRAGLNRPKVTHIGPNRVTVEGRMGGRQVKILFANSPGCPRL